MASSSRSRPKTKKVGLSRMDAAFDHLLPWGFSKQEISSTIKSLLKAYGGDEGWVFLEEKGYELVIETILDRKIANEEDSPLPQLPPPPSPAPEKRKEDEQQQNGDCDAEMGMEEQRHCNGGGTEVDTPVPVEREFMDESLLHVIPPGRCRPPLYGYLSETDSDVDFHAAIGSP